MLCAYLATAMPSLINFTFVYFLKKLLLFFVFLIISKNSLYNMSINLWPGAYEANNFSQCLMSFIF